MRSKQPQPAALNGADRAWRHGKILISALTVGAISLIAILIWYYLRQREAIETTAAKEVAAIAQIKVKQIVNWRRERMGDGNMLEVPGVQRMARRVLSGQTGDLFERSELLSLMRALENQFLYSGVALVGRDGRIQLQLNAGPSDPSRIGELGRVAATLKYVSLGDLYLDPVLHRQLMALSVPVQGFGAFIFTIDPERFLFPFVKAWPVPSATGKTILFRLEGNTVVDLSDFPNPRQLSLGASHSVPGSPLRQVNNQVSWMFDQLDDRRTRVLASMLPVPDSPWFVVAKLDASEVDAPVKRLGWEMVLMVALLAFANIAAVALVWRNNQIHAYQQRDSLLRQMADETPALLWTTNGNSMFINKALADFVGGSQNQKLQGTWRTYVHPDDEERVAENYYRSVANGVEFNEEHRLRRFDGEYRWVVAKGLPKPFGQGASLTYSGSLLDITERKLAEMEIKDLTARLINAQEEERTRLARELHDDLGQQIAALNLAVGNLRREIPHELVAPRSQSERIREKLVHLANATRRLSHELHPAVLQHCGLEIALRAFCAEFNALAGIEVFFRSSGTFDRLSPTAALCAFRVAQEALQNVAKHSGANRADVSLAQSAETVTLTVFDYGRGMDPNTSRPGLGLTSIKERARLVNGTVEIHSRPTGGTALTLTLPYSVDAALTDRADREQSRALSI